MKQTNAWFENLNYQQFSQYGYSDMSFRVNIVHNYFFYFQHQLILLL
jgi:hypothetical protein